MMQAGGSHQPGNAPPQPPAAMVAQPVPANDPSLFQAEKPLHPFALYDAVLDIPHPGASSAAPVEVIYPPESATGGGNVDVLPLEVLQNEFGEDLRRQGVAKIARFAFPEYEDGANAKEVAQRQAVIARSPTTPDGKPSGAGLNRHDAYLEEVFPAAAATNNNLTSSGSLTANAPAMFVSGSSNRSDSGPNKTSGSLPSYHVFCHKLTDGTVMHGHVRRYLPFHEQVGGRRDVGRRGVRALVILTRNPGGGNRLYSGLLKTLDALSLKGEALVNVEHSETKQEATTAFMYSVFREHVNTCRTVVAAMSANNANKPILNKPRFISVPMVELGRGHGLFGSVDTVKFAIPPSLLSLRESTSEVAALSRNEMLPMLRCLGVVKTMRLLSALMSERRVVFTSNNKSKLSAVSYGAVAMMGQGLLSPPPVFVPVLAPGLVSLLGTKSAYLVGVLSGATANFINVRKVPNIGPVVIFDLDNDETEPCYHNIPDPHQFVPDLTRRNVEDMDAGSGVSLPDSLYQDLTKVLLNDKKLFWQGAVQERLGAVATKGKTAARAAMKKGLKYLKNKSGKDSMDSKVESAEDDTEEEIVQPPNEGAKSVGKGNYFYEHGFPSEVGEDEARIAFATFFVGLYGDLRTYLTVNAPGNPPVVDKMKFMKARARSGDSPGTAMFLLLGHFMRSTLFDKFATARLRELQMRRAVSEDAPLFVLVTNHHRSNKIDFYLNKVRISVKEMASLLPGRYLISWNESVRRRTLDLTSIQAPSGDLGKVLTQLIADCNETSLLVDTMMVLWTRTQEGRGLQWKKTLLALQIIRDLILNGPINAVTEVMDGFASIRILKEYKEALRGQNSAQIRKVAVEIYALLVDLPVLFARRRKSVNDRWLLANPKPSPLRKETRMLKGISQFRTVHQILRPNGAQVAPAPPEGDLLQFSPPGKAPVKAQNEFLSLIDSAPQPPQTNGDVFTMTAVSEAMPNSATSQHIRPANVNQQLSQTVQNLSLPRNQQIVQQQHHFSSPSDQERQATMASYNTPVQQVVAPQNYPQYPNFTSPPVQMMGQQSQTQPQPNGANYSFPPSQMIHPQQVPSQQHFNAHPHQLQEHLNSGGNNGVAQNQQAYPHFATNANQPIFVQNQSQTAQPMPPATSVKKAPMNFDPFA